MIVIRHPIQPLPSSYPHLCEAWFGRECGEDPTEVLSSSAHLADRPIAGAAYLIVSARGGDFDRQRPEHQWSSFLGRRRRGN